MKLAADLRTLLAALWLGAALFFIVVAQSAFAVLPTRELAGAVVNRTLEVLNYGGLITGMILLASSFVSRQNAKRAAHFLRLEQVFLLLLTGACAFGQFVIGGKLRRLREQIGQPIDQLAADDSLRVAFNSWHGYSVWVLMLAMAAALGAFFLIARRRRSAANQYH